MTFHNITSCFLSAMPHVGRGIKAQYSPSTLSSVTAAVNRWMSYRQAALTYGIPKSTIRDRVMGRIPKGTKPGKRTALPTDVEMKLAGAVQSASQSGFGLT